MRDCSKSIYFFMIFTLVDYIPGIVILWNLGAMFMFCKHYKLKAISWFTRENIEMCTTNEEQCALRMLELGASTVYIANISWILN